MRLAPLNCATWVRQDASRQSLQPTSCQRAPMKPTNSRARGSHHADPLVLNRPSANTLVLVSGRGRPRGHRIARRHLRSRVMWRLAPPHQPRLFPLSPPRRRPPVFLSRGVEPGVGIFSLRRTRAVDPRALPVALWVAGPLSRAFAPHRRGPFPQIPAKGFTSEARSAFHRQVPSASSLLALRRGLGAATDPEA